MSRRYSPPAAAPTSAVGFYGCAYRGRGRLVRVAFAGDGTPPRSAEVACPVCGTRHAVAPSWRAAVDADAGREPEIVVEAEECSP